MAHELASVVVRGGRALVRLRRGETGARQRDERRGRRGRRGVSAQGNTAEHQASNSSNTSVHACSRSMVWWCGVLLQRVCLSGIRV